MGQMHFDVPQQAADFFQASWWQDAYLCGIEGVPWQTHNTFHPADPKHLHGAGVLTLTRGVDTSAKLLITCPVKDIGFRVLTTCSLRCQAEPHRLLIELARGSCYRVRLQADTWQRGGLTLNDEFDQLLEAGTQAFIAASRSHSQPHPDQTLQAIEAINLLEQAAFQLGEMFSSQSLAFRQTREPRLNTMMAAAILPPRDDADDVVKHVTGSGAIEKSFNASAVRISWGDIEDDSGNNDYAGVDEVIQHCAAAGIRVIGGPLVDHRRGMLPDWLTLASDDFDRQLSSMIEFVEATVNHFRGRVHLWNAASGLNTAGPFGLDDEQVMRCSIGVLQTIRRCDPNTPVVISIDQPCGEYLAKDAHGISPLHYADALLRSGLGLAGIGLNFQFGYQDGQTHPRSSIDFAHVIDRWATLNAPLLVQLSVPASPGDDKLARFKTTSQSLSPTLDSKPADWAKQQFEFVKPLVQTLLAKQVVHAIVWDGFNDARPHVTPHSGVLDAMGKPRPLLKYFTNVREKILM